VTQTQADWTARCPLRRWDSYDRLAWHSVQTLEAAKGACKTQQKTEYIVREIKHLTSFFI